jgi:hypothetical protein
MSLSLNYPTTGPSLMLDFANSGVLDPRITFTRASTATYFDASGTLQSAATDAPRLDYNPSTLAAQGLLIEESRTNSIRNNTMVGAVAGTPGTAPTNWFISPSAGVTSSVVGTGTENGVTYIDVRFNGTPSATANCVIGFETANAIAALTGQTWTNSTYLKLAAGSLTNITGVNLGIIENTSGGVFVAGALYPLSSPTSAALSTQRQSATRTLSGGATVAAVQPTFSVGVTNGLAIDLTLRIGLPQLELGAFATSVIPTTSTAVTRAADVASVNTLSPWFNASSGTLYGEITDAAITVSGISRRIATIGDAPNTDVIAVAYAGATGVSTAFVTDNNVNQATFLSPSGAYAQPTKVALAYAANDFQASVNGSAFSAVTSGTVPTVTKMSLGDAIITAVGRNLNGHLRRVTYYPRRLSQAELIAITA